MVKEFYQVFFVNQNKFVTIIVEKLDICNKFFWEQYQPIVNNVILSKSSTTPSENKLNDINFDNEKILKVTHSLDT